MRLNRALICLVCSFTVFFASAPGVHGQHGQGCYLTIRNVNLPESAPAGQPFEVDVTFTAVCPEGGTYFIRVDLVDLTTSKIVSSTRTTYSTVGPLTATVRIDLVAPTTIGFWLLQLNLYMLDTVGAPVAPQSQQNFGISIVPYVPTSSATTSVTSSAASTSISSSAPSVTSSTTVVTSSSIATSSGGSGTSPWLTASVLVGVFAVVIGVLIIRKRQRAKRERTRVY